jgi:hypothetical protein
LASNAFHRNLERTAVRKLYLGDMGVRVFTETGIEKLT